MTFKLIFSPLGFILGVKNGRTCNGLTLKHLHSSQDGNYFACIKNNSQTVVHC